MAYPNISQSHPQTSSSSDDDPPVIVVGAGIVGLVLALALKQQLGITPIVYEKSTQFQPVGAGMSLYPNGLRVLRDLGLLKSVQNAGIPYSTRQWERHDGSVIMTAQEEVLGRNESDTTELRTVGIKRWKLQIILLSAVQAKGIPICFGKHVQNVSENSSNGTVRVELQDGTHSTASLLFAADGVKSVVRQYVVGVLPQQDTNPLKHAGTTTVMGLASIPRNDTISIVTSLTSQCHAVFFPVSPTEQCFQFHFPTESATDCEQWGTMTTTMEQEQCQKLAQRLTKDGWDEQYIRPLRSVSQVIRIDSCLLDQKLEKWTRGNVVLLGDAAHPPVPFLGQGAQQGLEDAGTLALLLRALCCSTRGKLEQSNLTQALKLYEQIRVPRANELLDLSQFTGSQRRKRSQSAKYAIIREEILQRQVFFHETNPNMLPGATHDYRKAVEMVLRSLPNRMPILIEGDEEASTSECQHGVFAC